MNRATVSVVVLCWLVAVGAAVAWFQFVQKGPSQPPAAPTPERTAARNTVPDQQPQARDPAAEAPAGTGPTKAEPDLRGTTVPEPAKPLRKPRENKPASPEMQEAFRRLTGDDLEARKTGAQDLVRFADSGQEAAIALLLEAMQHADAEVRLVAIQAMQVPRYGPFESIYILSRKDPDARVRAVIALALRDEDATAAGPTLMKMLSDPEPEVLRLAVQSLGELRYKAAQPDITSLAGHYDDNVAVEAAVAIRRLGDPSAAERWVEILGARVGSPNAGERQQTARLLGVLGMEECRPRLETLAQDSDQAVREEAARSLKLLK